MSVTPSSPIVGIFTDQSMAERAVEALENAGFEHEQIRYSVPGSSGGFFEDLKSLFTGTSANEDSLVNDLIGMGLSDGEAQYYSKEYSSGNIILAVQAPGREQEASSILQQYGAYNSKGLINQTANYVQQPSASPVQESYVTQTSIPPFQDNAQNWQAQPQVQTTDESPFEDRQQDIVTSERSAEYGTAQPVTSRYDTQENLVIPERETEIQASQTSVDAPDYDTEDQTAPSDVAAPEQLTDYQAPQENVLPPEQKAETQNVLPVETGNAAEPQATQEDVVAPERLADYWTAQPDGGASVSETANQPSQSSDASPDYSIQAQTAQSDVVAPEHLTDYQVPTNVGTSQQEAEMQASQPGDASTAHTDELAQLMEQIQATRRQLEEAKARLQAEKEREAQFQATREREQQLQTARQQLQEMQSELQATLAELQATQARHTQYQ